MKPDDPTPGSKDPFDAAVPRSPAAVVRALGCALDADATDRENVGSRIGPYKLLQKIGQGGFGTVWMAEQIEPIRRRVALKVVKAGLDTDEVIARFEAERQALALMDHPNIARVFDAGATASGRPYFVMELVRGVEITRYCDENRLSADARLRLFIAVCSAVQHAHQKGVIHRDLKPSNILVTLHDGVPVPKVIDFGIAKATDKQLTEKTLVTQFHAFIGTPIYVSPEQMEMSGLDVDTRSDIYSLGVLLYELLAGRPPFDSNALLKSGLEAMRRTIREIDPPRPSARLRTLSDEERTTVAGRRGTEPAKLSGLLRGDLDWIVMRCLEKDRTRRYQTAGDLAADVLHHLHDEPVVARPPSAAYRLKKAIRRNRTASIFLAILGVLIAIGLAILAYASRTETVAKQRRDQIQSIFSRALAVADPGYTPGHPGYSMGRTATIKELLDATVPAAFADDPRFEASIRGLMGATYCKLGFFESAAPHLEAAWAIRQSLLAEDDPDYLTSLRDLGVLRLWQQRYDEAEAALGRVRAIQEQTLGRDAEETLRSRHEIAFGRILRLTLFSEFTFTDQRKFLEDTERLARESYELARRRLGPENALTLLHEQDIGSILVFRGQRGAEQPAQLYTEAELLFERNYQASQRVLGAEHPVTLGAAVNIGWVLLLLERNEEAVKCLEPCVPVCERVMGAEHFFTARALQTLERALRLTNRIDEANQLVPRYVAVWIRTYGPSNKWSHEFVLRRLRPLAGTQKQPEIVVRFAQERLAEFRDRDRLRPDSPAIATMRVAIALARLFQSHTAEDAGKPEQAATLFAEGAHELSEATAILARAEPDARLHWMVHRDYGNYYTRHGKFAAAEAELLLAENHLKTMHPLDTMSRKEYANVLGGLVRLYRRWNQPEPAARWEALLEAFDPAFAKRLNTPASAPPKQ